MTFLSKTVAERTPQGQRQSVQEQSYVAHVYNRGGAEQLAGGSIFVTVLHNVESFSSRYHHRRGVPCSTSVLFAQQGS